jgi:thiol-disulfide isomerase/thioredoxin
MITQKRLLTISLVLGLCAGAGILYVKNEAFVHPSSDLVCLITDAKKSALNSAASGDIAAMTPNSQNFNLADLAFNNPKGQSIPISSFKGRVVLLNLWATWCAPCRKEMADLNELQKQVGDKAFEVVAVNVDSDDGTKRKEFLQKQKINQLNDYFEPSMTFFNALKNKGLAYGLPATLLISSDGCLLASMNGPAHWAGADALKFIKTVKQINGI